MVKSLLKHWETLETVSIDLCLEAIKSLGRIKNFNCVDFLTNNLQGKSFGVAVESANSLGMIGDKIAISPLLEAGKSQDPVIVQVPIKFRELIHAKGELPSLPDIVGKVSEKMKDPNCSLEDIADL